MTWTWSELTSDVRAAEGVQIRVGKSDEGTQVGATRVGLTLDNRSGDYSPRNPNGANYGTLAKGTPIEVRITRILDTFTRSGALGTDADSGLTWATVGATWATTGTAATSALGSANTFNQATVADAGGHDVDVTHVSSISAVATGAAWVDATIVRRVDDDNYYRLHTEFGTGGVISCKIMRVLAGATTTLADTTSTGVSYSAGTVIKTRVRAVGARLQVRAWLNSGSEPTTWTCEADDDDVNGTGVGLYEWRVNGNTNVGTMTCTIDNFQSDVIRATTPVPEWPVRWDMTGNNVTAPISGNGILSRLAQGQSSQRSALYRQLIAQNPHGYWPLEDGSSATVGASAVARGRPATQAGASFGSTEAPGGATASVTLNSFSSGSRITGGINGPPLTADGYAGMALFKLGSAPGSSQNLIRFFATGAVYQWQISVSATNFGLSGVDVGGTSVVSSSVAHSLTLTDWFAVQLEVEENGANLDWALIWHQVGEDGFLALTGTIAGGTGERITGWTATAPVDDTQVSHVWLGDNDLPFVDATFLAVAAGYAGETAGARLVRLCAEEGIPLAVIGDVADTAPMGVQPIATFLELARECEAADQGVLYERGAGLGYLTRTARYNGTPVLELDFDDGHIAQPPEPVDDDQQLRNRIKLKRTGGSEETVEDEASIAESGVYPDELTVNLKMDAQLLNQASWRLHLGTHGELRWPRIDLNLARNPDLIADWCKVRIGSRITIANPPDAVAGGDLDLIVEGWTETLSTFRWDVTLVCSPAKPWDVAVYDTTLVGSGSTTTGSTLTASSGTGESLTLNYTTAAGRWSQTAVPFFISARGEVLLVTAMGAPSGTTPTISQVATVDRAVNGIAVAHAVGEAVQIYAAPRYAL